MPQYAVPDADIVDGNWLDQGASNVDMYADIAPGTPGAIGAGDDGTYIESPLAPTDEACAFNLSNVTDPLSSSGHILRWRRGKSAAGGAQIDLIVDLRQGYVDEGTPGSKLNNAAGTWQDDNIPDAFTTQTYTLLPAEADAITDYTDLQVRFVADQP